MSVCIVTIVWNNDSGYILVVWSLVQHICTRSKHFIECTAPEVLFCFHGHIYGFLEWHVKTEERQSKTISTSHNRVELKEGPHIIKNIWFHRCPANTRWLYGGQVSSSPHHSTALNRCYMTHSNRQTLLYDLLKFSFRSWEASTGCLTKQVSYKVGVLQSFLTKVSFCVNITLLQLSKETKD